MATKAQLKKAVTLMTNQAIIKMENSMNDGSWKEEAIKIHQEEVKQLDNMEASLTMLLKSGNYDNLLKGMKAYDDAARAHKAGEFTSMSRYDIEHTCRILNNLKNGHDTGVFCFAEYRAREAMKQKIETQKKTLRLESKKIKSFIDSCATADEAAKELLEKGIHLNASETEKKYALATIDDINFNVFKQMQQFVSDDEN